MAAMKRADATKAVVGTWKNDDVIYTFNADGTGYIDNGDGTGIGTTYEVAADKNEVTIHPGTPEVSDVYTYAMPDADTLVLTDKDGKELVLKHVTG